MRHVQCVLTKGKVTHLAWIPATLAVRGLYVELLGENGWRIDEVYRFGQDLATLRANQRIKLPSLAE